VTTVKRANADGEDDVVRLFVGLQGEVLAASWRTSMRPEAIWSAAAALAWAMAVRIGRWPVRAR